jgi:3-phosphoshikimate 1-carboxyvinyltransferase
MAVLELQGGQPVRGTLRVPGDKSISHRALLLAARAEGVSRISGLSTGQDVVDTQAAVVAMGAVVEGDRVTGGQLHEPDGVVWVGNSGTGIRLLRRLSVADGAGR